MPDTVSFATKPQLARRLIETALAGGVGQLVHAGDRLDRVAGVTDAY